MELDLNRNFSKPTNREFEDKVFTTHFSDEGLVVNSDIDSKESILSEIAAENEVLKSLDSLIQDKEHQRCGAVKTKILTDVGN